MERLVTLIETFLTCINVTAEDDHLFQMLMLCRASSYAEKVKLDKNVLMRRTHRKVVALFLNRGPLIIDIKAVVN